MRNINQVNVPFGIKIDFCNGVHVVFPPSNKKLRLKVWSPINGEAVFDGEFPTAFDHMTEFRSVQTYYVPWIVEIKQNNQNIFVHHLNMTGRQVCVDMSTASLDSVIAWMPAVAAFQYNFNARLTVAMPPEFIELFAGVYTKVHFIGKDDLRPEDFYAVYPLGNWGYGNFNNNPTDFQKDNMSEHAGGILGVKVDKNQPPELIPASNRVEAEKGKYVCIAAKSDKKMKEWNNAEGWKKTISFLKQAGYRVFCLDDDAIIQSSEVDKLPENDDSSIVAKLNLMRGADFFVGVPNGFAWLAWACKKPVVMIAGCTEAFTEFPTQYRICSESACHGCFNAEDMRFTEYDKCPCNKNYECTGAITAAKVAEVIKSIPAFRSKEN